MEMEKMWDGDSEYTFKVVLIGNSGVGKSSLMLQFVEHTFSPNIASTTSAADFGKKGIHIDSQVVNINIWDTAGQERFRSVTTSFYRGAHGIMMVYDVTDRASFEDMHKWLVEIEKHASEGVQMILIGNKTDLEDKREVKVEEGQGFANFLGIPFVETSAKDSKNVEEAFLKLARIIKENIELEQLHPEPEQLVFVSESHDNSKNSLCSC